MVESERLLFRKFTLDDLPTLIEQRTDPEVSKFLGGTRLQNPEALGKRIRFYISCYDTHGFGNCVMIWKPTGEVIGSAGIQPLDGTDEIEVGYTMIKEYWGRGIGTEAARAWLHHGFVNAGLERIVAVAHVDHWASRHIMEKLGMRYEKTEFHYGAECAFYAISKDRFLGVAS
ncbi:MAG TPA: GNAT family N-acetyltransferase [Pyrinomonadaceae bacterium]|nr:GNAT family N-acetyltransferase [Pyrinomonadaceae bacterium]